MGTFLLYLAEHIIKVLLWFRSSATEGGWPPAPSTGFRLFLLNPAPAPQCCSPPRAHQSPLMSISDPASSKEYRETRMRWAVAARPLCVILFLTILEISIQFWSLPGCVIIQTLLCTQVTFQNVCILASLERSSYLSFTPQGEIIRGLTS